MINTVNALTANGRFTFGATSWWRNGGSNPTETAVQIWKCIARPNLCGTPRLREAATTLSASERKRRREWRNKRKVQSESVVQKEECPEKV